MTRCANIGRRFSWPATITALLAAIGFAIWLQTAR